MAYVVTHGPLGEETESLCETPEEALPFVLGLISADAIGIMVTSYETGEEAIETLRILVEHRSSWSEPHPEPA